MTKLEFPFYLEGFNIKTVKIRHRPSWCWSGWYWNLLPGFCPLTYRLLIFKFNFKRLSKRSVFVEVKSVSFSFLCSKKLTSSTSKWKPQGVRSYPRWNGPLTRIFRSDTWVVWKHPVSRQKSRSFSCQCIFLGPRIHRQIEHLKPWSAQVPKCAWSENEQKPYCF